MEDIHHQTVRPKVTDPDMFDIDPLEDRIKPNTPVNNITNAVVDADEDDSDDEDDDTAPTKSKSNKKKNIIDMFKNNKITVLIIVLAVIIIGIVVYFVSKKDNGGIAKPEIEQSRSQKLMNKFKKSSPTVPIEPATKYDSAAMPQVPQVPPAPTHEAIAQLPQSAILKMKNHIAAPPRAPPSDDEDDSDVDEVVEPTHPAEPVAMVEKPAGVVEKSIAPTEQLKNTLNASEFDEEFDLSEYLKANADIQVIEDNVEPTETVESPVEPPVEHMEPPVEQNDDSTAVQVDTTKSTCSALTAKGIYCTKAANADGKCHIHSRK